MKNRIRIIDLAIAYNYYRHILILKHVHMYRESGVAIDFLARLNNGNVTDIGYQALLRTSITVTDALLVSLGHCSVSGMTMRLNISIIESESEGIQLSVTMLMH